MFVFHQRDFFHGSRQVFYLSLNYHSRLWLQLEPYYFEPNMLLTSKIIAVKIAGKNELRWPSLCQVSCKFFASQVFLCRQNESHKNGLPAKYGVKIEVSKVEFCVACENSRPSKFCASFENHFFRIVRALEREKSLCSLAICEEKTEHFGVTFSFKGTWLDSAFTSHDFSCLVFAQYSISKHLSEFYMQWMVIDASRPFRNVELLFS